MKRILASALSLLAACGFATVADAGFEQSPGPSGPMAIHGLASLPDGGESAKGGTMSLPTGGQPGNRVWGGTVGTGNENARVPVDMYWKNSLFECLIYPSDLEDFTGRFTGLSFWNDFDSDDVFGKPVLIWMGTTTLPNLAGGWIPATELTLVFNGLVDFPAGANVITLTFSQPFDYFNRENLVIMAQRPMDTNYYLSSDYFKCQTWGSNRARKAQSDNTVLDPANPPATSTLSGQFPKTGFVYSPVEVGILQGSVLGAGNLPVQNATVQVLNTYFNDQTDASGNYRIHLPVGTYSVSVTAPGYVEQTIADVAINLDQTTILNISLSPVDSDDPQAPALSTSFLGCSPNPFKGQTTISYSLKEPASLRLEVYNARGQMIRRLVDGMRTAGLQEAVWDGLDDARKPVSAGIYLLRMESGGRQSVRKVVLVK